MQPEQDTGRISVSEDRLRSVIFEFELRLRSFIDEKIQHKADQGVVDQLKADHDKHLIRTEALERRAERNDAVGVWRRYWVQALSIAVSSIWWLPSLIHHLSKAH